MKRYLVPLLLAISLAACIEEPASSPSDSTADDGITTLDGGGDPGMDAGADMSPADMSAADMTPPDDMSLMCSQGFEACDDGRCVPLSREATSCGGCMPVNCARSDIPNATPICNEEYECDFTCDENYDDRDGDAENGCECSIGIDEPGDGIDANCDGFDGFPADYIYVSNDTGDDANDGTTPDNAVASIARAIEIVDNIQPARTRIAIEATSTPYPAGLTFDARSIALDGGFSVNEGEWTPSNQSAKLETSSAEKPVLTISNLGNLELVELRNLDLQGPVATVEGDAVYTMRIEDVTHSQALIFENLTVRGGAGGDGADRMPSNNGAQGGPGGNSMSDGQGGAGGTSPCGATGGKGGNATDCSFVKAQDGDYGVSNPGSGGDGGDNFCNGVMADSNDDIDGQPGDPGDAGDGGDRAELPEDTNGSFDADGYWEPAVLADGEDGEDGQGGGGGGGGGSFENTQMVTNLGPGGSGGGGGGCGGDGGQAGQPGGASIAVAIVDSNVVVDGLLVEHGQGGNGGKGGDGGCGGDGGPAGQGLVGNNGAGAGGLGGMGGPGGPGGGGNGGPGGPTYGIVTVNSTLDGDAAYTMGVASSGGAAGESPVPCPGDKQGEGGEPGADGDIKTLLEL